MDLPIMDNLKEERCMEKAYTYGLKLEIGLKAVIRRTCVRAEEPTSTVQANSKQGSGETEF